MDTSNRQHWSGRLAFILAASGSAIGLGNVWKFPYIAGVNGGSAFVLVYLLCILAVGLPLMIAEIYIGKKSQKNSVNAFEELHKKGSPWQGVGLIGMISCFLVLSFYSVVGGWVLDFEFRFLTGSFLSQSDEMVKSYFVNLVESRQGTQIFWHSIFIFATVGIVSKGVSDGLERWNKILMPALFILLLFLFVYSLFLDGIGDSLRYLFLADFSKLSWKAVLDAVGHSFFTLSLGMGSMIIYGSYLEKEGPVFRPALMVVFLDTFIALIAGVIIFSVVFTFGAEPSAGPGLMFITLPLLFKQIPGSWFVSNAFFVLIAFAALTSAISLLEVIVAYFIESRGWNRKKTTWIAGFVIWTCGILCAYPKLILMGGKNVFDLFDIFSSKIAMPIAGILTSIFFGWILGPVALEQAVGKCPRFLLILLLWTLRIIAPIGVVIMLYKGVSELS